MRGSGRGLFITGTDTGVGKTYVACGIARSLADCGVDVGIMKPVETGCRKNRDKLIPADAVSLIHAAGVNDALDLVNPYRFSRPLAPSIAARFERKRIDPAKIRNSFRLLARLHDCMIVEGAGGIMVPLTDDYSYLDLASAFSLPVVIIARPCLGTINHTLLTISAIRKRRLTIAGVVINYASSNWKRGFAERTGPREIETASKVRILGIVHNGATRFEGIVRSLRNDRFLP